MRFENGETITLEQDINRIWLLHGLEVIEESLPAHPDDPVATWIIKAKPKQSIKETRYRLTEEGRKIAKYLKY